MPPKSPRLSENVLLGWAVKLAIFATAGLISWGAWDFRDAAADLKAVRDGFAALTTRVALTERDLANNSANDIVAVKRIGRLEGRVFQMGGSLDVPTVTMP